MTIPFGVRWGTLRDRCAELPDDATLITPLANNRFRITGIQDQRIIIIKDTDTGDSQPLQREQFESLAERVGDATSADGDAFAFDRLPPKAEPYAAVLRLHPNYEIDERAGIMTEVEDPSDTALDDQPHIAPAETDESSDDRTEPEVPVYADALLLLDALERHDPTALEDIETPGLINLYTLLSDVQRNANVLRKDVSDVLLDRVGHDRPVQVRLGSTHDAPPALAQGRRGRSRRARRCRHRPRAGARR
jgi:hypothetical protein